MQSGYSVRISRTILNDITKTAQNLRGCKDGYKVVYAIDWTFKDFFTDNVKRPIGKKILKEAKLMSSEVLVSFRCEPEVMERLMKYFNRKTITETVKCCLLVFVKYYTKITLGKLSDSEYLASRFGAKKYDLLKKIKEIIEQIKVEKRFSVYAEPFMGTSNVFLHLPLSKQELKSLKKYLNDADVHIVNLFNVLQKYPDDFIKALLVDVNKKIFEDMQNLRDEIELPTRNKKDQIASAVAFYYTLLLACHGDMNYLRKDATSDTVEKKMNTIRKIAELLEDVSISKNDWEYFLKKIMKKHENEKVLIYADPPYIFTEDVYDASKEGFNHKKFGKTLLSFDPERVTFLLSYRATIRDSDSNRKKNLTDKDVQKILDDIYRKEDSCIKQDSCTKPDTYIAFAKASNDSNETQVEVLISNFDFQGSVPYNDEIAILMKKQGFA